MKPYIAIAILLLSVTNASAVDAPGYYITSGNDTIKTLVRVPRLLLGGINFRKLYRELECTDSTGIVNLLTADVIKGFGFEYKSRKYVFYAKPIEEGKNYFLEPVISGHQTSLFQYRVDNESSVLECYTFEKADGTYLFLTNYDSLDKLSRQLKSFYGGKLAVQQLIDTKFKARRKIQEDIRSILEAVNKS